MKKLILFFSLLLCSMSLLAQPDFSALKYGVRAGLGLGSIDASYNDSGYETMGGFAFTAGAFAELPVWKSLSVVAEVNYEHASISDVAKSMHMEGSGLASVTVFNETKTEFPINFIHIPVLAKFNFLKNDLLYLEAGPQFGLRVGNVNSHYETKTTAKPAIGESIITTDKRDSDDTDNYKKGHVSLALGWGFNFKRFSAGLRVGLCLSDLQAEEHKLDGMRVSHTDAHLAVRYYF